LPLLPLPWRSWLPCAVVDARRDRLGGDRARLALYAWWMVAVLAFFSVPASKLVGYILPALAPWCLWLGASATHRPRAWRLTFVVSALTCVIAVAWLALKPPHSSAAEAELMAG